MFRDASLTAESKSTCVIEPLSRAETPEKPRHLALAIRRDLQRDLGDRAASGLEPG